MFDITPWRRKRDELEPSTGEMDFRRDFDDFVHRFFGEEPARFLGQSFSPAIDIVEKDNEILITAEIPGIDQKDLEVDLAGGVLTIKGEKKEEREEKGENYHRVERSFGSFSRSFTLPSEVQEDKVEAKYKDGILSLTLPKSESSKKKTIPVQVLH
jgi:HSP20 family protein